MAQALENIGRYQRQELFAGFGSDAQTRLSSGRVTIVGCGGLGTSLAEQLVRAGIGFVRLVDGDKVELGNIHRQHLFTQADIGLAKVEVAQKALSTINDKVEVETVDQMLDQSNAAQLLSDSDIVLDALDNFASRAVLNRWCATLGKPWVFCGVSGSELITTCIIPGKTGCLSCGLDMPDEGKSHPGILPPVVWAASGLQAVEVFKFYACGSDTMNCELLAMDLWTMAVKKLKPAPKDPNCPICGVKG